ncbi:MAG: hypothetical protein A2898_01770 [Candidatus Kerfeldbacteria bacterium RIFCSPLOWO2_01_FULL_48_11]|uniref:Uncharacterized protein n=1 Tax=Candidatus Kerfeldbacteria bacterium RIFCSPLOWO2_01_FULL_48_11 TaxID=1798543 RepID=A0A1G2B468_9BACT|nr:MAG: hypothetical protein UY34_C0010G0099 [Parcubacteria group bacterium GW2011_GWA2_48_9]KKW14896.1 MAG: hypothetical protein UY52_C0021G0005 [Parcubacteria group bacterium GW2011_GWC2_49_9]OGY83982.1 MAG: hypothetical protein A2898_01770 [Candidatus Kerfeldbacteria bacterium RIFCSPLOWO2_01_FULL_48_11]HCJ52643.1 hypothetical protein [Candidatus Kerfeldbacteria bacterium]
MFLHANLNPTPAKKVVYLCSSVILGILLSLIAHAVVESLYISSALDRNASIIWYTAFGGLKGACALHPAIQWSLLIGGAVGGYFLGKFWWRLVYIDRRWSKDKVEPAPTQKQ